MSELTKEQYEELPEFLKENYIPDDDGYSHKGFLKVKNTANDLDKQSKATASELAKYKEEESQRIAEAEQKAYEKAKAEGNTEEMETRLQQKIEDAERRANETKAQFAERMSKLAEKQKNVLASELANKYATKGGENAYKILVSKFIEIDPETDEETFLDDDGRATSLKRADFEVWIKKHSLLEALTRADVVTDGGGNSNGSQSSSRATKKPSEMNSAERLEWKQRDPVGFKQAFKLN